MKPELTVTKDLITIDTRSALNGEDVLHLTNAHAIDDRTGQDLTAKLLVNMADVHLGQTGIYDATISILDENGSLQPLRQISIMVVASNNEQNSFAQQTGQQTQTPRRQTASEYEQEQPVQQNSEQEKTNSKEPRKKKRHWVKRIVYALLAILAIYLVWTGISYYQTRQQVGDQGRQIGELQRKNDSLGDQLDTANTQIKELRRNYKTTKNAVKNYKKDEDGYRQQYLNQMQQVSQSLASLKQQLDSQTQQNGIIYNIMNDRLGNLQTTVNQMLSARSADQAQDVLDNYKWYK